MRVCIICGGEHRANGLCSRCYKCTPEYKAKSREYYQRPEIKARAHIRNVSPARKAYDKKRNSTLKRKAYEKKRNIIRKEKRRQLRLELNTIKKNDPFERIRYGIRLVFNRREYNQQPKIKEYRLRQDIRQKRKEYLKIWRAKNGKEHERMRYLTPKRKTYLKAYKNRLEVRDRIKWKRMEDYYKKRKAHLERAAEYRSRPYVKVRRKNYLRVWWATPSGKMASVKHSAKRRFLGRKIVNPEYVNEPGFHGHHIDKDHIIYIPNSLHKSVWHAQKYPETMERINTLVFSWLIGGYLVD